MPGRSFSSRLRWSIVFPAVAALAVAAAILWPQLKNLLEQATAQNLSKSLAVLAPLVEPHLGDEPPMLESWIGELGRRSDLRLTVIRGDGLVLADSERDLAQVAAMDNHADRPEVIQALASRRGEAVRHSATLGIDFVYSARRITDASGSVHILRLAAPISGLSSLLGGTARSFAWALGVALALVVFFSWAAHRTLFRPLARLVEDAGDLLGRQPGRRVEIPEDRELSSLARALNRLSEDAESRLAALESEEAHLSSVVGSMSEGVLVTDSRGRATLVNPAWRELFGLTGDVEGLSVLELTRQTRLDRMIRDTLESGVGCQEEAELQTRPARTVLLTSSLLSSGGGAVVVAREITPFLRLTEMRRDFVANVSHELKTPLSAIRGMAETLEDGALEDEEAARRFVGRILKQCERLELILSDLLVLSRLEHMTVEGETAPVDLGLLLRDAIEALEGQVEDRRIQLSLDVEDTPPIAGNADALERMILNLLENAIKYNRPEGSVRLRLRRDAEDLVLEVEDSGIGIPPASLDRLFERFYRVDKGRSRAEGGTGLGLAIVKHAAQLHDGSVEVSSELGRGSTFRVRLPLGRSVEPV